MTRTWTTDARATITRQGRCGICGGPYARHRMIDTQMERVVAGEPIDGVAADYDTTVADMVTEWAALIDLYAESADPDA